MNFLKILLYFKKNNFPENVHIQISSNKKEQIYLFNPINGNLMVLSFYVHKHILTKNKLQLLD